MDDSLDLAGDDALKAARVELGVSDDAKVRTIFQYIQDAGLRCGLWNGRLWMEE